MIPLRDYQNLIEDLSDSREAAEYLNVALEDGDGEIVAIALRIVIAAQSLPLPS